VRKRKRVLNPFIEEEAAVDEDDDEDDFDDDDEVGEGAWSWLMPCIVS
jgi:hypothetical protein